MPLSASPHATFSRSEEAQGCRSTHDTGTCSSMHGGRPPCLKNSASSCGSRASSAQRPQGRRCPRPPRHTNRVCRGASSMQTACQLPRPAGRELQRGCGSHHQLRSGTGIRQGSINAGQQGRGGWRGNQQLPGHAGDPSGKQLKGLGRGWGIHREMTFPTGIRELPPEGGAS